MFTRELERNLKGTWMKEGRQVEYIIIWYRLYEQEQRIPTVNINFLYINKEAGP